MSIYLFRLDICRFIGIQLLYLNFYFWEQNLQPTWACWIAKRGCFFENVSIGPRKRCSWLWSKYLRITVYMKLSISTLQLHHEMVHCNTPLVGSRSRSKHRNNLSCSNKEVSPRYYQVYHPTLWPSLINLLPCFKELRSDWPYQYSYFRKLLFLGNLDLNITQMFWI